MNMTQLQPYPQRRDGSMMNASGLFAPPIMQNTSKQNLNQVLMKKVQY